MTEKTMTEETLIERFSELSDKSLAEQEGDRLIERLKERAPYAMDLINHRISLDKEDAEHFLAKEKLVLDRLKRERTLVLQEMEKLGKTRKASKTYLYSSLFPFPTVPIYFDKKG
jgi:hypothetical protein